MNLLSSPRNRSLCTGLALALLVAPVTASTSFW
jgi:hypothetical protein